MNCGEFDGPIILKFDRCALGCDLQICKHSIQRRPEFCGRNSTAMHLNSHLNSFCSRAPEHFIATASERPYIVISKEKTLTKIGRWRIELDSSKCALADDIAPAEL